MQPKILNQEILLFTATSFCNRPFSKKEPDADSGQNLSSMEELERACWAGLLYEILPELVGDALQRHENYIWNTGSGTNFLSVTMGPVPTSVERSTSINPYFFLHVQGAAN